MDRKSSDDFSWWEVFSRIKEVAVFLGVLFLIIIPFQIQNFTNNQNNNSIQLLLHLEDKLALSSNKNILDSINNKEPILINNGGKFTNQELDELLNRYEELGNYYDKNLVSLDLICGWFGDSLLTVMYTPEVENYLDSVHRGNPYYFTSLSSLKVALEKYRCLSTKKYTEIPTPK